jgi:outer membrane protein assembly factor BamE (lipoprotein component of BamABCDE complex)
MSREALRLALRGLAILGLLLGGGCFSTGTRAIADQELISRIEVGKSTRKDLTALLGPPLTAAYPGKEEIWNYYYRVDVPLAPNYIFFVKIFKDGVAQKTQILRVTFNQEGIVKNIERTRFSGTAEQPSE